MKYLGHNFEQSLLYLSHPTLGCSGPKLVTFYKKYVLFTGWAVYLEEVLNGKDWKEREEDLSIQKKFPSPIYLRVFDNLSLTLRSGRVRSLTKIQ